MWALLDGKKLPSILQMSGSSVKQAKAKHRLTADKGVQGTYHQYLRTKSWYNILTETMHQVQVSK